MIVYRLGSYKYHTKCDIFVFNDVCFTESAIKFIIDDPLTLTLGPYHTNFYVKPVTPTWWERESLETYKIFATCMDWYMRYKKLRVKN